MNNLILKKFYQKKKNAITQFLGPVVDYNFPDWAFSMGAKWTVNYSGLHNSPPFADFST